MVGLGDGVLRTLILGMLRIRRARHVSIRTTEMSKGIERASTPDRAKMAATRLLENLILTDEEILN